MLETWALTNYLRFFFSPFLFWLTDHYLKLTIQAMLCVSDLPLSRWNVEQQLGESHSEQGYPSSQETRFFHETQK